MVRIEFSSRLNFREYLLATVSLTLDHWWKITLYVLLILFSFFNMHIMLYKLIFVGCVVVIPATVLFLAWQNYRNNPLIREEIKFNLDSSHIEMKGESFELKRGWEEMYRVSESSRYCFFWITKRLAIPVLSSAINTETRTQIREYISAYPGVKNDLSGE